MKPKPILSVLMCLLSQRRELAEPLMQKIRTQIRLSGQWVEFLVEEDDGQVPSGVKRNNLLRNSTGQYVAFVDDDDDITSRYIESMTAGCKSGADVVAFSLLRQGDDRADEINHFSIRNPGDAILPRIPAPTFFKRTLYRANHLCPWKRDLATMIAFPDEIGYADDVFWYTPLMMSGFAKTEYDCGRILYIYQWHSKSTNQQTRDSIDRTRRWCGNGIECFEWEDNIWVATQNANATKSYNEVPCRTGIYGEIGAVPRSKARQICVVKV